MKRFIASLTAVVLVTLGVVVPVTAASAAGTPDVQVTRTVDASTLYGKNVAITLSATQTTGPQSYNLSFTDVLPAGAVITSSTYPVSKLIPLLDGKTQVVWSNVADLATGAVVPLSYTYSYPTGTYDVGAVFTGTGGAYVNSDPRLVPKFDAVTGAPVLASFTGSAIATSSTTLVPFLVKKSEPSPESELLRGVHDHKTVYTVKITNNLVKSTSGFTLTDYLPAGLEFLGCANVDNSAAGTVEYPGSGRIDATGLPTFTNPCPAPTTVSTVTTDPDGVGPLPNAVYTKVEWASLGSLAASGTLSIDYAAAIPLKSNVASAGIATANLDNNTGPLTSDEQSLTNLAVASGVSGGSSYSVSDSMTVSAEDVAMQKTTNQPAITQGAASAWTLNIESSEYALSTGPITVVDTLPDGLDFASSTPAPSSVSTPATDGTIKITWTLTGFAAKSGTSTITLNTVTRATYRATGGPVSANDSWTNSATLTSPTTLITASDGSTSVLPVGDASSAGQKATGVQLNKQVAAPGVSLPVDCGTGTGLSFQQTQQGPFHPGDRVCYLLSADFPGGLNTLNNSFTDFLPAGYSFESYKLGTGNTVTGVNFSGGTASAPNPTWAISDASVGTRFEAVVTTRITDADAIQTGDITSNLFKLTYQNSSGEVFQLRALADTLVTKPVIALSKGITELNAIPVPGAPVKTVTVQGGDAVTYAVKVTNSGQQDATNVSVRDLLPPLVTCTAVSAISDAGSCDTGGNRIDWTVPTVTAGTSVTVTYVVTTPTAAAPGDTYLNTAGVRTYQGTTNTGTPFDYYPSSNIDPSLETQANADPAKDTAEADVVQPTIVKTASTGVTEAGNSGAQATIGEIVTYTVTASIPQGTSLYGTASVTDVVNNRLQIVGTPTYTVAGGTAQNATVVGATITAPITTTYVNAPNSGDDLVVVTFTARVKDVGGPVRGNRIPNSASLGWANAVGTARTVTSNILQTTIVEPLITIPKSSDAVAGKVVAGQVVTYTLGLTNSGATNVSTAHDLVIVDTIPVDIDPLDAGGTVAISGILPSGGVWDSVARTITFTRASLAPGATDPISYQAKVRDPLVSASSIVNTVTATTTSLAGTDPDERTSTSSAGGTGSGYQATSSVTLAAPAISLTKTASPATRTIGDVVTYTVDVTIPASVVAYDTTVIDTLAAHTRFDQLLSATCLQGAGLCSPAITAGVIGTPTDTDSTIGFFLGDLNPASTGDRVVRLVYTGIVTPGAVSGDTLTNSAAPFYNRTDKITGTPTTVPGGVSFDSSGAAKTANVSVVEPLLTINKTVVGQIADSDTRRAKPGETLTYTVAVTNTGTSPAYAVKVTDNPDRHVTGFTSTPPSGVVGTDTDPSDGTLAWTIAGPIAVNATVTITYSVTMPNYTAADEVVAGPEIVNTADVPSYAGVDPALQQPGISYSDYDNVTADVVSVELDLASIAKHVWFDANADGIQTAGEPSLSGVGITVLYAGADGVFGTADDETHTTTTDANGDYLVDQLPGGLYRVTAATPTGMTPSYDLDGGTTTPNGIWQGTLAENAVKTDVNFGFTGTGTIGDRVWFDQNGNSTQDTGEPGLSGIPVSVVWGGPDGNLSTTADNVTYQTTTGANGGYLVSKLPSGPYSVTLGTLPAGYTVDSDPAGGTSNASTLTLAAGQNDLLQDFGLNGTGSIGDFIWLDRNGDGVQDATEPGIVGAGVALTWLGVDGVAGGGDDATFTTTTDSAGKYLFSNLLPGKYSVAVTGGLPLAATNSYDRDGNKNSVTPVTLATGQTDLGVDFGYKVTSVIGDRVWWDVNRDGVQDPTEPGIPGVGIRVTYLGPDGILGGGDDLVFTTTTDSTGAWNVTNVPDGNYVVSVISGVPAGFSPTYDADSGTVAPNQSSMLTLTGSDLNQDFGYAGTGSIGDTVWLDLNADGVQGVNEPGLAGFTATLVWFGPNGVKGGGDDVIFSTTTDSTGKYLFPSLPAGEFTVSVTPPSTSPGLMPTYDLDGGNDSTTRVTLPAATALTTADFGYIGSGSIGNSVWLDQNGNGSKDSGEPGLAGVTATLVWAGLDGVIGTSDDVTSTTTTDSAGHYLFDRLPAGVFSVTLSNLPPGISPTADPDGGADSTSELTLLGGASNLAQNFGYVGDAGVGDLVWLDVNHDGIRGTTEPGIPDILLTVRSAGADGVFDTLDDIVVQQRTDVSGKYLVEGLPAGEVRVSYDPTELPLGYVPSSDLDGADAFSAVATLTTGPPRLDVDFVVVGSATLNGTVFNDRDGNGVRNGGEPGIPGIGVVIVWNGPSGDVTLRTTTDAEGAWQLPTLPSGKYTVTLDPTTFPSGFRPTTATASTVELPPFGVRSVVSGLTTLALAFTGGAPGILGVMALLLLLGGAFTLTVARLRRRNA